MKSEGAQRRALWEIRVKQCLEQRRAFWLCGLQGIGKARAVRDLVVRSAAAHRLEVVSLAPGDEDGGWAEALFGVFDEPGPAGGAMAVWRAWCERLADAGEGLFVVVDGWRWTPSAIRGDGPAWLLRRGLSCGFVAASAPMSLVGAEAMQHLEVIDYRPSDEGLEAGWREAICVELLDELPAGCKRELAVGARVAHPISPARYWTIFDRGELRPALERGLLQERVGGVVMDPQWREVVAELLEPTGEQTWALLECIWDSFEEHAEKTWPRDPDISRVATLLECFAMAAEAEAAGPESSREDLREVMAGLDEHFHLLLTPEFVSPALNALERVPAGLMQEMPAARFRLAQCLSAGPRGAQAHQLLEGLTRMSSTVAGKRAFLWRQMLRALRGEGEAAIAALWEFREHRLDLDDPLESLTSLVLARMLTTRGKFEQAIEVTTAGIRAAKVHGATRDLHTLRVFEGMSRALSDERVRGVAMAEDACDRLAELGMVHARAEAVHVLATLFLELGEPERAGVALDEAKRVYERLGDMRNLLMVRVKRAIVAMERGERLEEAPSVGLARSQVMPVWPYLQAEAEFADGLFELGSGGRVAALEHLRCAWALHLEVGNLGAMPRVLGRYLPLLLESGDVLGCREVLSKASELGVSERARRVLGGASLSAMSLAGDLGAWEVFGQTLAVGAEPTLFPRSAEVKKRQGLPDWERAWHRVVRGEAVEEPEYGAVLMPLFRAWRFAWAGDLVASRRQLFAADQVELRGSLFGFLRGLLAHGLRTCEPTRLAGARRDMIGFWRSLSPMLVLQQLGFWDDLLAQTRERRACGVFEALEAWLAVVDAWRVEEAMLVDAELGEVYWSGDRVDLGRETVAFEALCELARVAERGGRWIGVRELFEAVWRRPFNPESSPNNVYVAIGHLRQMLDGDSAESVISLERGVGYRLDVPVVLARSLVG